MNEEELDDLNPANSTHAHKAQIELVKETKKLREQMEENATIQKVLTFAIALFSAIQIGLQLT